MARDITSHIERHGVAMWVSTGSAGRHGTAREAGQVDANYCEVRLEASRLTTIRWFRSPPPHWPGAGVTAPPPPEVQPCGPRCGGAPTGRV